MTFIPTLNAIKVTLIGTIAGQEIVIDITIGTPAAVTLGDLSAASVDCIDWLSTEMLPILTDSYEFNECKAYDLSSVSAPVISTPLTLAGAINSAPVANNVAMVTSFLTLGRGRSARGRNYLAGIQSIGGTPTSSDPTIPPQVVAAWAAINSYLNPDSLDHVVISTRTGGADRAAGLKQNVTNYRTNADWDSQRRRLAGRGV